VHEAGDAVIGRKLAQSCDAVSIVRKGDSIGHAVIAVPWETVAVWDARGRWRRYESICRGRIMALMAGAETEIVILGESAGGDSYDRSEIDAMIAFELGTVAGGRLGARGGGYGCEQRGYATATERQSSTSPTL
jgi:hypothetical protein